MLHLNQNAQMGSALATAFNHRETFLNGGTAVTEQEINSQPIGDIEDFNLPECLKNLSLEEIFKKDKLSDDEIEKLKESHANDNLPLMPTDPTQLSDFIAMVNSSVKAELAILKSAPLSEEEYLTRFQKLQL